MSAQPIDVVFDQGVYLPETDLWLDPHGKKPVAFVSHAHADHVAPHEVSICSTVTRRLIEKRYRHRGKIESHEFGEEFERNGFRFEMLPAGHILGSAQLRAERMADGESLLFSGDFKLRPGAAAEPAEWKPADTLVMETTFGLPRYRLPPPEETVARLIQFLAEAFENNQVPIVGAYSLGKAQEVLLSLHRHPRSPGFQFVLHRAAAEMTEIYREFGYETPEWEVLGPEVSLSGKVIIAPPNTFRSKLLRSIENRVTVMISGWGADASAKYRYGVDEVLPLSDHADYDDLIRCVERVNPSRILTMHGFAEEFAADLRRRGREAWSLTGVNQLELPLGDTAME